MSESPTIANESVELTTGTKMPILGLGTWRLRGSSAVNALLRALEVGYRHVDTATAYGKEEQVGQAVAQSGVRREEIFVTTKLPPGRAGRERETLEASLDGLAFGYVDLWLIQKEPATAGSRDCSELQDADRDGETPVLPAVLLARSRSLLAPRSFEPIGGGTAVMPRRTTITDS